MKKLWPQKLKAGDEVRVVAPSLSMSIISQETRETANRRFAELGLKLSFGRYVELSDLFGSSSIENRISDLHDAFGDPNIKAIASVIGGYNCNQLLRYIDWDLVKRNPKIFFGFSDTTALNNAIYAKTGLITYSAPAYSSFGKEINFEYTFEYFKRCVFDYEELNILPSTTWSNDEWWKDQADENLIPNDGLWLLNEGTARGTIIGGNLCTLNLLQGTEYMPDLADSILFIEDDHESTAGHFDRDLQSLIHLPSFGGVKGIVIGRFEKASKVTKQQLAQLIRTKPELRHMPIITNVDFGHTDPKITFPVGGVVDIKASEATIAIAIVEH